MESKSLISASEVETAGVARELAANLHPGDVVLFYGDLGAGKTAFIRGLVDYFDRSMMVTSPTFTLINVYPTKPKIVHFDLYRLRDENDLLDLGFDEYLAGENIVLVEWAEKCGRLTPSPAYKIRLAIESETSRRISIESNNGQ